MKRIISSKLIEILKKLIQGSIICSLVLNSILFSQGTIKHDSLYSNSLGYYKKVDLYLPQGYNPTGTTRYRVIYFLHGAGGNQGSYSDIYGVLDSLISHNVIQPVIVVKPDGSVQPFWGSFYTNSALYGPFEDYIVNEVIQYIDVHYKTTADRNHRCIMGHSMGGYGCMKLALKHFILFRAVASHSGPLDLYHVVDAIPYVLQESGGGPPYTYNPNNGIFSGLGFSMCGAFSPHLNFPPYNVDFLLNSNGVLIDSVFAKWKPHNPAKLSSNINASTNLPIYFDCGLQDELTLLAWNNSFRDTLVVRSIPFVYYTFNGGHNNQLKSRYPFSLKFLDSAMNHPIGIEQLSSEVPQKFILYQNYPNPFNPTTKIKFDVPSNQSPLYERVVGGFVTLKIYDILGREVATLVNEKLQPGTYEVEFDGSNYPSGVYFYNLIVSDPETSSGSSFTETKRMVLIK
jgi:S-formylglutathione hydrolase FrmB